MFGVYEEVTARIQRMASTIPLLFEEVLASLEKELDRGLVVSALSLLATSRGGLLEDELMQLMGTAGEPLPRSVWAQLYRSIKNYLRPSGEGGTKLAMMMATTVVRMMGMMVMVMMTMMTAVMKIVMLMTMIKTLFWKRIFFSIAHSQARVC